MWQTKALAFVQTQANEVSFYYQLVLLLLKQIVIRKSPMDLATKKILLIIGFIAVFGGLLYVISNQNKPQSAPRTFQQITQAPKSIAATMEMGKEYYNILYINYNGNTQYNADGLKVSVSNEDFLEMCKIAGISQRGVYGLTSGMGMISYLSRNGDITNLSLEVKPNREPGKQCIANITAEGIYNGNSTRASHSGRVLSFIKNDSGKILAVDVSMFQ